MLFLAFVACLSEKPKNCWLKLDVTWKEYYVLRWTVKMITFRGHMTLAFERILSITWKLLFQTLSQFYVVITLRSINYATRQKLMNSHHLLHHHHFHYPSLLSFTPGSKLTFFTNHSHHSLPQLWDWFHGFCEQFRTLLVHRFLFYSLIFSFLFLIHVLH